MLHDLCVTVCVCSEGNALFHIKWVEIDYRCIPFGLADDRHYKSSRHFVSNKSSVQMPGFKRTPLVHLELNESPFSIGLTEMSN